MTKNLYSGLREFSCILQIKNLLNIPIWGYLIKQHMLFYSSFFTYHCKFKTI